MGLKMSWVFAYQDVYLPQHLLPQFIISYKLNVSVCVCKYECTSVCFCVCSGRCCSSLTTPFIKLLSSFLLLLFLNLWEKWLALGRLANASFGISTKSKSGHHAAQLSQVNNQNIFSDDALSDDKTEKTNRFMVYISCLKLASYECWSLMALSQIRIYP